MTSAATTSLQLALDRFDRWMESNLDDRGLWRTPCNADGYFSLACYAMERGRVAEAQRALRYIQDHHLGQDGNLVQGANRDNMLGYVPAWIAMAADRAEMFDLSRRMLDQVQAGQCPVTGGVFGSRQRDRVSFDVTTLGVIALAQGGRVDACAKGAEYLLMLYRHQPDLSQGFVAEPPDAMLRWDDKAQHYYKIGLFSLALIYAYGLLGDRRMLDAAVAVHQMTIERAKDLWSNTLSHKMAWSATALHAVTGESQYLDHARRFCQRLIEIQDPDGSFRYPELWPVFPPPNWAALPNIGCQFALWIARTLQRLPG